MYSRYVDMLLSLLLVQNYLRQLEQKNAAVLPSTAVCLLCF